MSVRDGLVAIMTLGPSYGLQLHGELMARAPHRKRVNVGQIYATLDRLTTHGLVENLDCTSDGLPLYSVTAAGTQSATEWMTTADTAPLPEWTEMLDQILITSSIQPASALTLSRTYRQWWEADLSATRSALTDDAAPRLALLAREAQALAALAWLTAAVADLAELNTARSLSQIRPARGRPVRARSVQSRSVQSRSEQSRQAQVQP